MNKKTIRIAGWALGLSMAVAGIATAASTQTKAIMANAAAGDSYALVTDANEIEDGDSIIIVRQSKDGAMSTTQNNNNRGYVSVTSINDVITIPNSSTIQELTVYEGSTSGNFGFYTGSGFLYGVSGQNYLRTTTDNTPAAADVTGASAWTLSTDANGVFSIVNTTIQKNSSNVYIAWNGSNSIFSAYGSGQQKPYIFKKIETVAITSLTMDATHSFYEGQSWTPTITYNEGGTAPTTATSELVIESGGEYVTIDNGTVVAKTGVVVGDPVTVVIKAHATDVQNSSVYSNTCTLTINKNNVISVEVTTAPTKVQYVEGQKLTLEGMVLEVTWTVGTTTINDSTGFDGITTSPSLNTSLTVDDHNETEVLVSYGGQTTAASKGFVIEVIAKQVANNGLTWTGMTATYEDGELLKADGLLTIEWNDGSIDEDVSVATLYSEGLVSFKIAGVNATPGETVLSAGTHDGKNINIYYGGKTTSAKLSVKVSGWQFLRQLTDASDIESGKDYVIAGFNDSKTYLLGAPAAATSQIAGSENADSWLENDMSGLRSMRADLGQYAWTITGDSETGFTLVDVNGKYLGHANGSNNKTSFTRYDAAQTGSNESKTLWRISDGVSYGSFGIVNKAATTRGIILNNANTFGAYATSNVNGTDYMNVEIYEIVDVSEMPMLSITCDGEGNNTANWSALSATFSGLSNIYKSYYRHASYNVTGTGLSTTVTATKGTNSSVAQFAAKYDYIVNKPSYSNEDFIGRQGTDYDLFKSSQDAMLFYAPADRNNSFVIAMIASLSVTAVTGAFLLARKRREEE